MDIIFAPNPVLSQKAKTVNKIDRSVLKIIAQMRQALDQARDPIGVGLAAPQIGRSLRIFIVKPDPKTKAQIFINPKILEIDNPSQSFTREHKVKDKKSEKEELHKLEGCLSLKDIWGQVLRSPKVIVSYLDERGQSHKKTFKGLFATIVQHETDHLEGILFTKRVLEQKGKLYQSHKDKKGEDVFEEIEI